MSSRMYKVGSVFTRTNGLIRKGVIPKDKIPVWFDLYYRFPPDYEPVFERPAPDIEIPEILYEEDVVRAKIQKMLPDKLGVINLTSTTPTTCQKFMSLYQDYTQNQGMSESEALEKIKEMATQGSLVQKNESSDLSSNKVQ